MPTPLDTFVQEFKATGRLAALDAPMLVWTNPTDKAAENTQEFTRPAPSEPVPARPAGKAIVFPVVRRAEAAGSIILGRSHECDIQLVDESVSRKHVDLLSTRHGWSAADRGSKNGTWIGQTRLLSNMPASLPDGARLQLGSVELIFMTEASFADYVAQLSRR